MENTSKKIMPQMKVFLNYLAEAEGLHIHKLEGEKDITSMYGIYRFANPQAKIFNRIDLIALKLGFSGSSKEWSSEDIRILNNHIDHNKDLKTELTNLAGDFYSEYYKKAHLDLFHRDCVVTMASMYANSRRLSLKAVQYAINTMTKNGFISYENLLEDGKVGQKTFKGLEACLNACESEKHLALLFESFLLLGMSSQYAQLVKKRPDKYLRFLLGWLNRLKQLQQRR